MSSSRFYYSSNPKSSRATETRIESHSCWKPGISKNIFQDDKLPDKEADRREQCSPSEGRSTRVLLLKEFSNMDDDDSSFIGKKGTWSGRLSHQKKMKLSEECAVGITESFENFCENHKRVRNRAHNENRSEASKVFKPSIQPKAERGIKVPQRPVTAAGKLSDIAATKFPDSIFKVYISEANRVVRKKRVISLLSSTDVKPLTPMKPRRSAHDNQIDESLRPEHLENIPQFPSQKTNQHLPMQNSCSPESSEVSHAPKRITLITDISLSKEEKEKRLKDRAMMRKRTMNMVKSGLSKHDMEDGKQEFYETHETDTGQENAEFGGGELSSQRKFTPTGKAPQNAVTLASSIAVTSKRFVSKGDGVMSGAVMGQLNRNKQKIISKKQKRTDHSHQMKCLTQGESKNQILKKSITEPRKYDKLSKGKFKFSNKRDSPLHNHKVCAMMPKETEEYPNVSSTEKEMSRNVTKKNDPGKYEDKKRFGTTSNNIKTCVKNSYYNRSSLERIQKRKNTKVHKINKTKRCTCGNLIKERHHDSRRHLKCKAGCKGRHKGPNGSQSDQEDSFHCKRNAIIKSHLTHKRQENADGCGSDPCGQFISKDGSHTSHREVDDVLRRGCSTPLLTKKSRYGDKSFGNSDTELFSKYINSKDISVRKELILPKTATNKAKTENEMPLKKIFGIVKKDTNNERDSIMKCSGFSRTSCESNDLPGENDAANEHSPDMPCSKSESKTKLLLDPEESLTAHYSKKEALLNSKSMGSLERNPSKQNTNDIPKKTASQCLPINPSLGESGRYYLVESYNVLTDPDSSSRSMTSGEPKSSYLLREQPMLNIPSDERMANYDDQVVPKQVDLTNKCTEEDFKNGNGEISTVLKEEECNVSADSLTKTSQKRKPIETSYNDTNETRNARLRKWSSVKDTGCLNSPVPETSDQTFGCSEFDSRNNSAVSEKDNSKVFQELGSKLVANKNTLLPKHLEERKERLENMLSRPESSGASRERKRILETWNSTQKSITERKKKILASIKDTTENEVRRQQDTKRFENLPQRSKTNEQISEMMENDSLNHEAAIQNDNVVPITKTEVNSEILEDEKTTGVEVNECQYFKDLIALPGSRQPQPYSSANTFIDLSPERDLEDELSPCCNDNTPEKPLCESYNLKSDMREYQINMSLDDNEECQMAPEIEDDEIPERDITNLPEITTSYHTERYSNEYFRDTRNSIFDTTRAITPTIERNIDSPRCLSIEELQPDENVSVPTKKPCLATSTTARNVIELCNSKTSKINSMSPVLSRSLSRSRTASSSRERSSSRRSQASSSTSSRRSVKLLERPPSRKPHLIESSEEDSDLDIQIPHTQPPMSFQTDELRSASQNVMEPLKKQPPSRMYSTLKESPLSTKKSIKSAIRDLHGLKHEAGTNISDGGRPISGGLSNSSNEKPSPRPASQMSRKTAHSPKMSPESARILQEKVNSISSNSSAAKNSNIKESIIDTRNNINPWIRSTRRKEFQRKPISPIDNRKHGKSPVNTSVNKKPPFRYYSSTSKCEKECYSKPIKPLSSPRKIPNYLPPWERVNLTPPESALKERALHEKKLGIVSKVTASNMEAMKNLEVYQISQSDKRSMESGGTPTGDRSPMSLTPVRNRTPVGSRTPKSCGTPLGKGTPPGNITPRNGTPTIAEMRAHIGCQSAANRPKVSSRPLHQVSNVKLLERCPYDGSDERLTADCSEVDSSRSNFGCDSFNMHAGGWQIEESSDLSLQSSRLVLESAEEDSEFASAVEEIPSRLCLRTRSDRHIFYHNCYDEAYCEKCYRRKRNKKKKSIDLTITSTPKSSAMSGVSLSLNV